MSNYIGNQPAFGEFKKLDSIVSLFNGSTTQFNLEYNSVNQSVGDATQLIVSLNGVVQEPGTAYTLGLGGGSIVFASAPASTDTCHIVSLGGVGGTTTPTDGSVTASKLDPNLKDYLEETFTADGTQTVFTLTRAVIGANTLLVTIDGIVQPSSAFTASGTTLTISEVLAVNTNVRVVHMGVKAGVYVPADDSVTADMLANSINTDIASKLPLAGGTMTGVIAGFTSTGIDDNATSTAITIDGSENVGIGTSSPQENLHISSTSGSSRIRMTSADGSDNMIVFGDASDSATGAIRFDHSDNSLSFNGFNNTERMRIDSSGNVGIGTGSIATNTKLLVRAATNQNFEVESSSGKLRLSALNDARSTNVPMQFASNSFEFLTGNVLVGKTVINSATVGVEARGDGRLFAGATSSYSAFFNRLSSDGAVVHIAKDDAIRGSIGVQGARPYFGNNINFSIKCDDANNGSLVPANQSGVPNNNVSDIGLASNRWNDLYLGGGVYLGGTGSANKLDNVEYGTYSLADASSGNFTFTVRYAVYKKVGQLVHVEFDIDYPSNTNGANAQLTIPFTPNVTYFSGIVGWSNNAVPIKIHGASSGAYLMNCGNSGAGNTHLTNANLSATRIIGSFYYSAT